MADQIALLATAAPAITNARVIPIGSVPFPSNIVTGALQGGSWSAGNAVIAQLFTAMILTPKTTPFAFAVRAKFGAPTAARTSQLGLINAAGTHSVNVGTTHAASATKFTLKVVNAGADPASPTTANADTTLQDFMIVNDTTNIKLYVAGADSGATLATSTLFSDEAYIPYAFNTITLDAIFQYMMVAW